MLNEPIVVRNLTKTYRTGFTGRFKALVNLSFAVEKGAVVAFVGPNGAGKTTTIHLILGFLKPTAGQALLFGAPPSFKALRRVGFQSETFHSFPYYTAKESLEFFGGLSGMSSSDLAQAVPRLLTDLDLENATNRRVSTFSKGMMQRLGLAQALIHRPDILILDEPTSGLDPDGRRLVLETIQSQKARGTTTLMSSHILADVERVCDHVVMIRSGELVLSQSTTSLATEGTTWQIIVRDLKSDAESFVNEVGAHVSDRNGEHVTILVETSKKQVLIERLVQSGVEIKTMQPLQGSGIERAYLNRAHDKK